VQLPLVPMLTTACSTLLKDTLLLLEFRICRCLLCPSADAAHLASSTLLFELSALRAYS
jgi:hypothetical protein